MLSENCAERKSHYANTFCLSFYKNEGQVGVNRDEFGQVGIS